MTQTRTLAVAAMLATLTFGRAAIAQDDPFADEPIDEGAEPEAGAASQPETEPAPAPAAESAPSPSAEDAAAAQGDASLDADAALGVDASLSAKPIDAPAAPPAAAAEAEAATVVTGSHIRRPRLLVDSALVIDSPLTTEVQGREYLQMRRQLGGVALPDTTAAFGFSKAGGPGTSALALRLQPTLILLNGRRLVDAPYSRTNGGAYVDLNQIPISMIERVETTKGLAAGLYGDGAIGGVINFVTRRDFDGVEVEVGAQSTDKFDQHEEDVSVTLGAGSQKTGVTAMVSYFTRQPLSAGDRDWIGAREDRVETLLGSPSSFLIAGDNTKYPIRDPYCELATQHGYANGTEVRLKGYGPPSTLSLLPAGQQMNVLTVHDVSSATSLLLPTMGNGMIDPLETSTYCTTDFTPLQDLVLEEERIQTYSSLWHAFSDHTEAYGEFGYYRNRNQNRTAPSFPVIRIVTDPNGTVPVFVPVTHADQPFLETGFAGREVPDPAARMAINQAIVGRIVGSYAGPNLNTRRVDVMRGVLGLDGDFEDLGKGTVLESWDWDLSGVYTTSEAVASVQDVLLDKLAEALNSCPATKEAIVAGQRVQVSTTIKERQELGCFNPFYSSVINNNAIDPLDLSARISANENGFPTTDSDQRGDDGFGLQDGGFICDPNDPDSPPCPAEFDRNGDGIFELAGTPNTKEVIDRLVGEHITLERRTLGTVDGLLRGDLAQFDGGGLGFALGAQYRRESLQVDYDAAYNQRLYGFLFGAADVPAVARDIGAGFAELRLRVLDGLLELQPAARLEHFSDVGTAVNALGGVALRPFAAMGAPPPALEWLLLRGHFGRGNVAPSLMQMHGSQNEFHSVEFNGSTLFVPYQINGNEALDFEKYTTISGGLQWDFSGVHVGADFWTTTIDDLIAADNAQTLVRDCQDQFDFSSVACPELLFLTDSRSLVHVEGMLRNNAQVETNGIDGGLSYTLDSEKRGLGAFGTFVVGAQGTFINSYKIKSPRALREHYRPRDAMGNPQRPVSNANGSRDYSNVSAEYEAAGWRNVENFAPAMPQLRFSVPVRWLYDVHQLGVTLRYIGSYNDDSEATVEKYANRPGILGAATDLSRLELAEGEVIDAWMVLDASYGLNFGDENWRTKISVGAINLLDAEPPEVESPLGYEIGLHDPRGRLIYARVSGEF